MSAIFFVKTSYNKIDILTEEYQLVVSHSRLYGQNRRSMKWQPYSNLMAKRLLTLKYTSFYSQLPTESESYFEACTVPEKQEALKLLATVLKDDNFNKITEALIIASKHDHPSVDSIKQVFYQFVNGRGIRQDIHNPLLSMPSCALRSAYERS